MAIKWGAPIHLATIYWSYLSFITFQLKFVQIVRPLYFIVSFTSKVIYVGMCSFSSHQLCPSSFVGEWSTRNTRYWVRVVGEWSTRNTRYWVRVVGEFSTCSPEISWLRCHSVCHYDIQSFWNVFENLNV